MENPITAIAKTYTQAGYHPPSQVSLDDETYRKVLPVWVKACVDAVLYFLPEEDPYRMVIGKRKIQPQKDWWIFGGRILVSDESIQAALARKLKDEIGLEVALERIPSEPARVHMYRWSDDHSVVLAPVFLVSISQEEYEQMLAALPQSPEYSELAALDPYAVWEGENYHPALRDCAEHLLSYINLS